MTPQSPRDLSLARGRGIGAGAGRQQGGLGSSDETAANTAICASNGRKQPEHTGGAALTASAVCYRQFEYMAARSRPASTSADELPRRVAGGSAVNSVVTSVPCATSDAVHEPDAASPVAPRTRPDRSKAPSGCCRDLYTLFLGSWRRHWWQRRKRS